MSSESNPTLPSSPATFRSQHYATNNISAAARAPTAPQGTNATGAAPDTGNEKGSNVQVVVRCRPQSEAEKRTSEPIVITNSSQSATITVQRQLKGKPDTKMFTFDQTYGQFSTQNEVYENAVKPLVDEVMAGFNCTVFAYGQTGTGKTYTMEGELTSDIHSKHAGVIPRSIHTIFEHLEKSGCESSVKVSFLEIYNEELSDLLTDQPTGFPHQQQDESKQLRIFEDTTGKKGTLVNNLEEILVTKAEEVFQLLQKSSQRRRTAETLLNKNSSRSHSVFTITVHTKETSDDGEDIIRTGKLHLVDLAGSECIGRSGAQNQRAKEAGKINQSLLTLGRVINALVEKAGYIPYRDSKLTRLLQESLGGRAKTVIIATVSPSMVCVDESMSTLDYAHRAKNIRNRPQVNQKMTRKAYMKELLMEIASLKRENEALRTKNGIYLPPEKYDALIADGRGKGAQLEELMFTLKAKEQELKELSDAFDMKEQELTDTKEAKQVVETKLEETEGVLQTTRTELKSTQDTLEQTQHVLTETVNTLTITQTHLEETQHLVEKHVETEKELTSQAQTLTSTLETVIIDKNALHDKINRKTIVEKHNDDVAIVLQQQVQTHVHEMGMMSDKMMEGQMANNAMLEGTIKQMQKQHGQQCADLNANLTSWDASLTQHTSSLRTLHASHHDTTQQMVNIQHDTQHKHSTAQMNACSALQQQHTSHISTLQNEMKSQSERVNTWANVERDAWNIQVNNVKQHVSQQQHAISTLSSTINEHHTQHSSTLTSQHDYLTTFIQQQTQQQQELQTSFISQVTSLFTSLLQQQQASMTKAFNEMQTVITQQQQVIQQQYQALQKQTTEMTSAVTTYGDDTVTTCNSNMTTSDASHTEITSQHDNITRHIDAISSHLNNTINDVVNVEKQHLITVDTAKDTLITSLSQQHDAVNVAIEKLQTDATLATQQHTSAVTAMASTVDTASTSCHTIIGEQVASIHTYQHANTDSLQSLHLRMDTYITSDRHSDKRTMTTPEKREFSYPHELVATREHDEILQEYRQQQAVAEKEHDAVQEIQSVDKNVTPLVVEPVNVVAAAETNTSIPLSFPTASSVESISPKSDISDTTMKSKIPTHVKKSSTSSLENEGIDKSSKSTKLAAGVEKSKLPQPKTRTRAPFAATNQ